MPRGYISISLAALEHMLLLPPTYKVVGVVESPYYSGVASIFVESDEIPDVAPGSQLLQVSPVYRRVSGAELVNIDIEQPTENA